MSHCSCLSVSHCHIIWDGFLAVSMIAEMTGIGLASATMSPAAVMMSMVAMFLGSVKSLQLQVLLSNTLLPLSQIIQYPSS